MPLSMKLVFGWPFLAIMRVFGFFLYPFQKFVVFLGMVNRLADRGLNLYCDWIYRPALRFLLRYPMMLLCPFAAVMAVFITAFAASVVFNENYDKQEK